jgi:hypothetical protein
MEAVVCWHCTVVLEQMKYSETGHWTVWLRTGLGFKMGSSECVDSVTLQVTLYISHQVSRRDKQALTAS